MDWCFFFSSRRRHTRYWRDWSSDVCSSDLRTLFTAMDQGFCVIEKIATAAGEPSDYRYVTANPAFERHTGMRDVVGKTIRQFVPDAEQAIMDRYDGVVSTGTPAR